MTHRKAVTWDERPELVKPAGEATKDAFFEYNYKADVIGRYWARVVEERRQFQFHVLEGDEIVARASTIPTRWDGTLEDLPEGIDDAIVRGFEEDGANVLCARPDRRSTRPSRAAGQHGRAARDVRPRAAPPARGAHRAGPAVLEGALSDHADRALRRVAARGRSPVRPLDPDPRAPRRTDSEPAPRSARITGTIAEWEEWTGTAFPESGEYVFPGCLATLEVDREHDCGRYWEPNVWMLHRVD